jgi:hypothetical protein
MAKTKPKTSKLITRKDGVQQHYNTGRQVPLAAASTPSSAGTPESEQQTPSFDAPPVIPVEYSDFQLNALAEGFEAAWPGAEPQPAQNIDGFGTGVQPRLSEYAVLFAVGLEDRGYEDAFKMVVNNRPQVEAAWGLGIEPLMLVEHRIANP